MFIGSYSLVWIPFLTTIFQNQRKKENFYLFLIAFICIPLQGFFNAIIYFRDNLDLIGSVRRASEFFKRHANSMSFPLSGRFSQVPDNISKALEEVRKMDEECQGESNINEENNLHREILNQDKEELNMREKADLQAHMEQGIIIPLPCHPSLPDQDSSEDNHFSEEKKEINGDRFRKI